MKVTLGGWFSIMLALLVAGLWAMLLLVLEDDRDAQEWGGFALYLLSFPIARLSGMFSHTQSGPPSEFYLYLLLQIPNVFVLGYSIAGVFYVLRRGFRLLRPKA